MKGISENLRGFRLANRRTLKELAKKAGGTDGTLSQLIRRHANSSIMILMLPSALQVKVVDFFLEDETNGNYMVLGGKKNGNITFRRGDAKIQMLVRDIQNRRMQPFYKTIEPGE